MDESMRHSIPTLERSRSTCRGRARVRVAGREEERRVSARRGSGSVFRRAHKLLLAQDFEI